VCGPSKPRTLSSFRPGWISHEILPRPGDKWEFLIWFCLYLQLYISVFVILSLLLFHKIIQQSGNKLKDKISVFYDFLLGSRQKNGVNADGHPDCKTSVFLLPFLSHKILPQSGDKWGFLTYFCLYLSFFVFVIARLFVLALSLKILSRSGDKRAFLLFWFVFSWTQNVKICFMFWMSWKYSNIKELQCNRWENMRILGKELQWFQTSLCLCWYIEGCWKKHSLLFAPCQTTCHLMRFGFTNSMFCRITDITFSVLFKCYQFVKSSNHEIIMH